MSPPSSNSSPHTALLAPETHRALAQALATLDAHASALLRRRYIEGQSEALLLQQAPHLAGAKALVEAEERALHELASALNEVRPAADGTPWSARTSRALLRLVGNATRRRTP
ncbi:MAG: hypothetical protein AAFN13_14235 [Bacteroidota bacterium]